MTALPAVLSRIEKATGPDREIDAALAQHFLGIDPPPQDWESDDPQNPWEEVGEFTASIDAALDLVEKVLPKARVELVIERNAYTNGKDLFECEVRNWGQPASVPALADGPTAPLAILAALLKSILAQQPGATA